MKKLGSFLKLIWKKSNEDELFTHAAALTYYSFIYLLPIFALFYFFFAYFNGFEKISDSIQGLVGAYLAPELAQILLSSLETIQREVSAETVGWFGIIGFIVSSFLMLYQIEFAFNAMLGGEPPQHRFKRLLRYALLMTIGPVFIGLSILTQQAVYKLSSGHITMDPLAILVSILPFISTIMFLTILYKWVSAIRLSWSTCLKAAVFSGFGIELLKQLYAFYVVYSLRGNAYGIMAVLPLFLIWVNTIWTITLFGGQLCDYLNSKDQKH